MTVATSGEVKAGITVAVRRATEKTLGPKADASGVEPLGAESGPARTRTAINGSRAAACSAASSTMPAGRGHIHTDDKELSGVRKPSSPIYS